MPFLVDWNSKHKNKFMSHIPPEIVQLLKEREFITWKKYKNLRVNSYSQRLLHEKLDDRALIHLTTQYLKEIGPKLGKYQIPASYNDAILRVLLPLLLTRFKDTMDNFDKNED